MSSPCNLPSNPLDIYMLHSDIALSISREIIMTKILLGVRVEPDMKAALERAAKREKRTLTAQVELILEEWLAARKKRSTK
jgi:hypothetical protein